MPSPLSARRPLRYSGAFCTLAFDVLSAGLLSLYGGEVCPLIEKLGPVHLGQLLLGVSENTSESSLYRITDMQGKTVLQGKMQTVQQSIDVSMLDNGLYTLILESEHRKQFRAIVSVIK